MSNLLAVLLGCSERTTCESLSSDFHGGGHCDFIYQACTEGDFTITFDEEGRCDDMETAMDDGKLLRLAARLAKECGRSVKFD